MKPLTIITILGVALALGSCSQTSTLSSRPAGMAKAFENLAKNWRPGLGFTIMTNEAVSDDSPRFPRANLPNSTWAEGVLSLVEPSGEIQPVGSLVLKSPFQEERLWSNRLFGCTTTENPENRFSRFHSDKIELTIRKLGNNLSGELKKWEGDTEVTFNIKFIGFIEKPNGSVFYGTYGGFQGLIAISLWRLTLPV